MEQTDGPARCFTLINLLIFTVSSAAGNGGKVGKGEVRENNCQIEKSGGIGGEGVERIKIRLQVLLLKLLQRLVIKKKLFVPRIVSKTMRGTAVISFLGCVLLKYLEK